MMATLITRIGVIGCGYGAQVLVPAFRADNRGEVVAIAARSRSRAEAAARKLGIPHYFDDWRDMLKGDQIDAIAIAAPPEAQSEIAQLAFECGLHVFAEKPLALTLAGAQLMMRAASASGHAHAIDFNFREITAVRAARDLLQANALGALRHVTVTWQLESYANEKKLASWKTNQGAGGGALSNFVSHALDYLEWMIGPIAELSARLAGMPNDERPNDTFVSLALRFAGGAAGSLVMSAAAYRGSGHRIEFYGDAGTLILENPGPDHMRGFRLRQANRPDDFRPVRIDADQDLWDDGRVLPSSRIIRRFLDWIHDGTPTGPDFSTGLRVQQLLDLARRSHAAGRWLDAGTSGLTP